MDMEEEDYCNEYLDYLKEIRNVITALTQHYYTSIVEAFFQMYVVLYIYFIVFIFYHNRCIINHQSSIITSIHLSFCHFIMFIL